MADKILFPRKCKKCGKILAEDEENLCIFCENSSDSVEEKQASEDKSRWLEREVNRW